MKKMKIYTKTGDKGTTGLLGGQRAGKDDVRLHAYGSVDECNAIIGLARTGKLDSDIDEKLLSIQNLLFIVGADLATPVDKKAVIDRVQEKDIEVLEKWIDELESDLPELKQFIIPAGTNGAVYLQLARTVCRRAERWVTTLFKEDDSAGLVLKFLNRLSDLFFVIARTVNHRAGISDTVWESPRGKEK
ncbi:MAG: cob(I)yrinic acid a,c-diamide adenosyltransferase [candidate division Zixibacteria bacterium]